MNFAERSRKKSDRKPLATGGQLYVHQGAVHTGAGFTSHAGTEADLINMFADMSPQAELLTKEARQELFETHAYK